MENINKGKKRFLVPLIAALLLTTAIPYFVERAESGEYKPPTLPDDPDVDPIPGIPDCYEKGDILMLELPGCYLENLAKDLWDMPPNVDFMGNPVINDHAALYMGRDFKPSDFYGYNNEYFNNSNLFNTKYDWKYYSNTEGVWFINALGEKGVHYNTIDYFIDVPDYDDKCNDRSWEYEYGHVVVELDRDVSSTIKNGAVQWAVGKLGDEYQDVTEDGWIKHAEYMEPQCDFPNSYKWYCTELVWAAYINQDPNIDLDNRPFSNPGVSGNDILKDDNYDKYNIHDSVSFL